MILDSSLGTIGSVAYLSAAILYQGNHDKLWNIVSPERFIKIVPLLKLITGVSYYYRLIVNLIYSELKPA